MRIEKSCCVRVRKERGEEVRRILKELHILRKDAKIKLDVDFIYLPIIEQEQKGWEIEKIGEDAEFLTTEFEILERETRIEEAIRLKPSFEIIGDIAVLTDTSLNQGLKVDERLRLVGEEIMKKHKNIKVVAKRISVVEGVFRTRKIEVIAGENRTETLHKENGYKYKVDLEKVYFNPRLSTERWRVASQAKSKERVIDMFAGVGSFSIQVARFARYVTAIDINPDAIRYLKENMELNRINNVEVVEGDVRHVFTQFKNTADRIIMNLPHKASEFLYEALSMLISDGGVLHYYDIVAYERGDRKKSEEIARSRSKEMLKKRLEEEDERFRCEIIDVRKVKSYAPYAYIIGMDVAVTSTCA